MQTLSLDATTLTPAFTIRPFTPADYEAYASVLDAVDPEHPETADEIRYRDENRDMKCHLERFLAEVNGRVVGYGSCGQWANLYHPQKFWLNIGVHPHYRRRGIGSALYNRVMAALEPFDPILLRAFTREDQLSGMRFVEARGFVEESRAWESRLDVASFDPAPYLGLEEGLRVKGIELKSLAELMHVEGWQRKVFELDWECSQDEPHPEPPTKPDPEVWIKNEFGSPSFMPESYLIAVAGDAWVGLNALFKRQGDEALYNGLTGVTRPYRRKGVALAMKVRNILWAKARGIKTIKTWNNTTNRPMLSINERLGYVKQPANVDYRKTLKELS